MNERYSRAAARVPRKVFHWCIGICPLASRPAPRALHRPHLRVADTPRVGLAGMLGQCLAGFQAVASFSRIGRPIVRRDKRLSSIGWLDDFLTLVSSKRRRPVTLPRDQHVVSVNERINNSLGLGIRCEAAGRRHRGVGQNTATAPAAFSSSHQSSSPLIPIRIP